MLCVRSRTALFGAPKVAPARPTRCSVQANADGGFEQQVQKLKDEVNLPVPLEYAYAGGAWGMRLTPGSDTDLPLLSM